MRRENEKGEGGEGISERENGVRKGREIKCRKKKNGN